MRNIRSESLTCRGLPFKDIGVCISTTSYKKLNPNATTLFKQGKYYHSGNSIADFTKVFQKNGSTLFSTPQSQRSIVNKKDPYITKLIPTSRQESIEVISVPTNRSTPKRLCTPQSTFTQRFRLKNAGQFPNSSGKTRLVLILYNQNITRESEKILRNTSTTFTQNILQNKCKQLDSLKYCYYHLPIPKQFSCQRDAEKALVEIGKDLIHQLKIGTVQLYFFTKKGEPINSLFECHPNHQTIVVTPTKQFNGISEEMMDKIQILERVIPTSPINHRIVSLEQHIAEKYKNQIMNIADFLQSPQNSMKLHSNEIESLYQKCKKKANLKIDEVFHKKFNSVQPVNQIQLKYNNVEDYMNDNMQITSTPQEKEKEKIIQKYDMELKQLQKEILQNHHHEADQRTILVEGKLIKKEHTQYNDTQIKKLEELIQAENYKPLIIATPKKSKLRIPQSKKNLLLELQKGQQNLLYYQNIPKLSKQTQLSRKELYQVHIMFKALEAVSSQLTENYQLGEGVTFKAFRNGIYQVFMQPRELAAQMFQKIDINFSGNLNWMEFLNLMVAIKAKTLMERLNLFISIADKDGNGLLSKQEILNLTRICLKRFVQQDSKLLELLCEYFTKLIFETLNVDENEEIPLVDIKNAILSEGPNSELLSMFCGADF